MAQISLFRSSCLTAEGVPVIKVIITGDEFSVSDAELVTAWLSDCMKNALVLEGAHDVRWIG